MGIKQGTLQTWLYSGVALIVVSMLFLVRDYQTQSFLAQAALILAAPVFFYGVGWLVYRYLEAPLAAPGILATGAWLVVVALFHLQLWRYALPDLFAPYYWSVASTITAFIVTLTGHRARIWLLVPLVPLMQINALWGIIGVLNISTAWVPGLSFGLVLAWWEAPIKSKRWQGIYQTSAVLLAAVLILLSYTLNTATTNSIVITWLTAAGVVVFLGWRHGWASFGPWVLLMLVCASIWGLPVVSWPLAWLTLATAAIILVEKSPPSTDADLSLFISIVLTGSATLVIALAPLYGVGIGGLYTAVTLLEAGMLFAWLGWRRDLHVAAHIGLWLMAAAWGQLYFALFDNREVFGLWLGLVGALALLTERVMASLRKSKHKQQTLKEAVLRWPLADLSLGLSLIVVLWMFFNLQVTTPWVIAVTMLVVVGIWLVAGLFYRLPVLLHIALWMAPLPFALLLMHALPALRDLMLIGMVWQLLGVGYVLLGHSLRRQRPAVLIPFFSTGYVIIALSLTLLLGQPDLAVFGLTVLILTGLGTSAAVIAGQHPAWTAIVESVIDRKKRPYAFDSLHNFFLLLTAWLMIVWLQLVLEMTTLPMAQQGLTLVVLSSVWIVLGRVLPRLPSVVGWPVYSAGWVLWTMGLLQVFHAPTEALVTIVLGLAVSVEALHRREIYWMPVFVLQLLFTALQLSWLLSLPPLTILILAMVVVAVISMALDRGGRSAARFAALSASLLAGGLWLIGLTTDIYATAALLLLVVVGVFKYQRWEWLLVTYGVAIAALLRFDLLLAIPWRLWSLLALVQLGVGVLLALYLRPRRHHKLTDALFTERDWASPPLWFGGLSLLPALAILTTTYHPLETLLLLVGLLLLALVSGWRDAPYMPLGFAVVIGGLQYVLSLEGDLTLNIVQVNLVLLVFALVARGLYWWPSARSRRFVWWLRPMRELSNLMAYIAIVLTLLLLFAGDLYYLQPGSLRQFQALSMVNALLLTLYFLMFVRFNGAKWLLPLIVFGWVAWGYLVLLLGLSGWLWYTLPLGIVLLLAAQRTHDPTYEFLAVVVILAGAGFGATSGGVASAWGVLAALQVLALLIYGYWVGRRIAFISGAIVIAAGLLWQIVTMNIWLLPLLLGLSLLGGALLFEVRGENAQRWLLDWQARWRNWR